MSKPIKKKILLTLDGGSFRGIMQLQLIKLLDEIIQKKNLYKVLQDHCKEPKSKEEIDGLFKAFKDSGDTSPIVAHLGEENEAKIEALDKALKKTFMDYVDYVAGVSVGSLIGCGLTVCDKKGNYKYTVGDLITYFQPEKLLKKTPWYDWRTDFDQSCLKKGLEDIFRKDDGSQATFDDIKKAKLLVISYNIDDNKETVFTNYRTNIKFYKDKNSFQRYIDVAKSKTTLVDVAMSSAAIQFGLPAYKMSYTLVNGENITNTYEVDGGSIRQSPLFEAISTIVVEPQIQLQDLVVVSIGTGTTDFDMSDLKDGSVFSYLKNFAGFGNDNFISSSILCEAGSTKDMVADLLADANTDGEKTFYDFNVKLDKKLYEASLSKSSIVPYSKAILGAYKEGSENYEILVALVDYLVALR